MSAALLAGKIAVVTGAGAGLGAAIARAVAAQGARVVVSDIDPDTAKNTAAGIEGAAVFFASDQSCWCTGSSLVLDGGFTGSLL